MSTFQGVGDLSASLTGLSLGTAYHLRVQAKNSAGEGWTPNSITFTTSATPLPPVVTVYDANATTFTTTGATLIGRLRSHDASDAPTVTLYYGLADKGLTDSGWDGNVAVGTVQAGADFAKPVTGLAGGKQYYYRAKATNSAGTSYSAVKATFVTIGVPACLLYTSPSPRDATLSRMPSSA